MVMKENSPNPESHKDVNLQRLLSGALHGAFISTESEHEHLCQMEVSRRRRRKRKRRFPSWELELGERDNEISE